MKYINNHYLYNIKVDMSLGDVKVQVDRRITEYKGRLWTNHAKRAENLRLGVLSAKSWNELIMVLTNENNLLEGKGCVNQYTTEEGYWTSSFAKDVKNVSATGAYYDLVNQSLNLVQEHKNISRESIINVANVMDYNRFDQSTIYPDDFKQSIIPDPFSSNQRFSISPYNELNMRKEKINELWSTQSK